MCHGENRTMRHDLVTVRLHGALADKYGGEHAFAIHTPREAIDALDTNYPGFRRDFTQTSHYALFVDGDWRDEENCPDVANAPIGWEIDFCPVIEGRAFAPIITALGWVGITGTAATVLSGVIAFGLLYGASMLLSPKPKQGTARESAKNENYIYGRCFVGSVVISAGLEVAEGVGTTTGNSWVWNKVAQPASYHEMALDDPAVVREALRQTPPEPPPEKIPSGRSPPWIPENA
jgi:predicted phage tail protein